MKKILTPEASLVEGQFDRIWTNAELLQDAACHAMDSLMGRDGAQIAAALGMQQRQFNKQRERDFDLLHKQWLFQLATALHFTAAAFGPARTAPVARLVCRAAGHDVAHQAPPAAVTGERESALALISRSVREVCDAATKFAARAEDGIDQADAIALLPEVQEGMEELRATYAALLKIAGKEDGTDGPRTRA